MKRFSLFLCLLWALAWSLPLHAQTSSFSTLWEAANSGDVEEVKRHLSAGADFNAADEQAQGALTRAAYWGHEEIVRLLLDAGVNPNIATHSGRTALHEAAFWGHTGVVELLLAAGADFSSLDAKGRSPIHEALEWKNTPTMALFQQHGVDLKQYLEPSDLVEAARAGYPDFFTLLLDTGLDVNAQDEDGRTALHEIAIWGYTDLAQQLLDAGAAVHAMDFYGETPLSLAEAHDQQETFALLQRVSEETLASLQITSYVDHPARVAAHIEFLNVRSSPTMEENNIIGQLTPGQLVHVLQSEGNWSQIRREDGLLGWSHNNYLHHQPARQIGDKRLFSYIDSSDRGVAREATLRYIGEHVYIYIDERDFDAGLPIDPAWLNRLGQLFDRRIYPETAKHWNTSTRPSHEGDERIIILLLGDGGGYYVRTHMWREPNPYDYRVGFMTAGIPEGLHDERTLYGVMETVVHELYHAFEHPVDRGNEEWWVGEGLASFGTFYLGYEEISHGLARSFFARPETQLTTFEREGYHYGASMLFVAYIHEQLGLEGWRAFATHPARGLDALDAVLADMGSELDAQIFFADWVIANYLNDKNVVDPKYRYQILEGSNTGSAETRRLILQLPAQIEDSNHQYAAYYYDVAMPASEQTQYLLMESQLDTPSVQDAWVQLVQVHDGQVQVQRFRASEYRNQPMKAALETGAEHTFIAISPFFPSRDDFPYQSNYTLIIRSTLPPG